MSTAGIGGHWVQFGASTIERWYYRALRESADPVAVLARKIREELGSHRSLNALLRLAIRTQHHQHPNWSYPGLHVKPNGGIIQKTAQSLVRL